MDDNQLFDLAQELNPPWFIEKVSFDPQQNRLDLFLDFKRRSKSLCTECRSREGCPVHDTVEKTSLSKRLNLFQQRGMGTNGHMCYRKELSLSTGVSRFEEIFQTAVAN